MKLTVQRDDIYDYPFDFTPEWNHNMYGKFDELVRFPERTMVFNAASLDADSRKLAVAHLTNLFKDGIYHKSIRSAKVRVLFAGGDEVVLSPFELLINLYLWLIPASLGKPITSRWFFWEEELTSSSLKSYINDNWLTTQDSLEVDIRTRNQIIADTLYQFTELDDFSFLFNNTFDVEEFIALRDEDPEVAEWMNQKDVGQRIPIDKVTSYLNGITRNVFNKIATTEIGVANAIRVGEIFNAKQARELLVGVGATVNGVSGKVFSYITDSSFIDTGLDNVVKYHIEMNKGRAAQMINFDNVGKSGAFARLLSLNNMETFLNKKEKFACDTQNLMEFTITDAATLSRLRNRYFKFHKNDEMVYQFELDPLKGEMNPDNPNKMIGRTIWLYSPMTCNSHAYGKGICHRCYGDLYYTNININPGQQAAETLSSQLTQRMLSAKHLLEANIQQINFNEAFHKYFYIDGTVIRLRSIEDVQDIIIPVASLMQEEDESETDVLYTIQNFFIVNSEGERIEIAMTSESTMYVALPLMSFLQDENTDVDAECTEFIIPAAEIDGCDMFIINLINNGLNSALVHVKSMLNKESLIAGKTKEEFLKEFVEAVSKGGINMDMVHIEVILSNQIRRYGDILSMPQWHIPNVKYQIVRLSKALMDNPSVCISLEYQGIKKQLIDPTTLMKKHKAEIDKIFMPQPQLFDEFKHVDRAHQVKEFSDDAPKSMIPFKWGGLKNDFTTAFQWEYTKQELFKDDMTVFRWK